MRILFGLIAGFVVGVAAKILKQQLGLDDDQGFKLVVYGIGCLIIGELVYVLPDGSEM